mmetsp:Transcript_11530/g.38528  ORF Transcript_11530/g.38528 Transcript_11530/m.38528 type:complete len:212 (+) Transcript_11530:940-1575(+)
MVEELRNRALHTLVHNVAHAVGVLALDPRVQLLAVDPLQRQHLFAAQVRKNFWDDDAAFRAARAGRAEDLREALRVDGLAPVVQLVDDAAHDLVRYQSQVRPRAEDLLERFGDVAAGDGVELDDLGDVVSLDLDRDDFPRAADAGLVHLPQRRGGDGLRRGVEAFEQSLGGRAEAGLDDAHSSDAVDGRHLVLEPGQLNAQLLWQNIAPRA